MIEYDAEAKKAEVSYPWTEDIWKLKDNQKQAVVFQSSVKRRLLKDENSVEACNTELRKFMDRGAITKLASDEITIYTGPVSYVSHHAVHKPESLMNAPMHCN